MSKHKYTNVVCSLILVFALLLSLLFLNGEKLGITASAATFPYVEKLFDTSKVHTIDIVVDDDDWQEMLSNAMAEEYISCNVVIDGESVRNVGIRPKGNTSLSQVASSDSDRYSFKIEFDHYDSSNSYYGLDKLALNKIIQDNTYLKDYLTYQMMQAAGVASPLSSFVYITVNGQDWGLYVAVEGVEESFLERNYGSDYGELYKPDSSSMNDQSNMEDAAQDGFGNRENIPQKPQNQQDSTQTQDSATVAETAKTTQDDTQAQEKQTFGGRGGGMNGSSDVSLQYTDDDPDSYQNIFNNAKTDVTSADEKRLIQSLQNLSTGTDLENTVDMDQVIRYFVVHNFVLNGDSYTGSMVHNYYLYEKDGQLSMIPWDYNLAFGGFSMGQSNSATSLVNYPLDDPLLSGSMEDRPMIAWIFENEEYLEQYHQVMDEFLTNFFENGTFDALMEETISLITPYVEKDPTAFCTLEEFQQGAATLQEFCSLRAESLRGQLDGTIPSTNEGQTQDSSTLIDASSLTISDMGSMGGGMGGGRGDATQQLPQQEEGTDDTQAPADDGSTNDSSQLPQLPSDGAPSGEPPSGQLPDGNTLPEDGQEGTFPQMGQGQQGMMPFSQQPGSNTQEGQDSQGTLPTQGDTQGEIPSVEDFPSGGQLPTGDDSQSSQSETESDQGQQGSTDSGQTQDGTDQTEGDTSQQQPPTDRDSGAMGQQGQRPDGTAATSTSLNFSTLSLVGGSILLLLLALLLVKKYRR